MNATVAPAGRPLPHPPLRSQPRLLRRIFADPQPVLDELCAAHGDVFGLGAGPVRMAVIGDPDTLRELFRMPADAFRWGHKFNVLAFVVGDQSLLVSDGEDHARRRRSVQAGFSRRRLNGWIPMIVDRTDAAVDELLATMPDAAEPVDLYRFGRRLVLQIVVRAQFGDRLADRADEIGELFQRPQDYLESPAIRQLPHPIPFTRRSRVRADRRALDALIDAEISMHRAQPSGDPVDMLESLVHESDLSDAEIRDQVVSLIGAGYDTTSATLAWMLWCTVLTPGLWGRLRSEADMVFGPHVQPGAGAPATRPDEHTLARLELADRVMRETTRLHPAGVVSPREAAADLTVGGYHIPRGTLILWSAHLAGRNPNAWIDPTRFDPDRYLDPDPGDIDHTTRTDFAWVPFGRGPRNCIGFALAQMELTLIIARLAQRLDIEADSLDKPRPVGMVVNRPDGGAPMRVRHRPG
jgi:cytochrome P450